MTKISLTFALDGDVTLGDYSQSLDALTSLINELTKEVSQEANIEWMIEELYSGSATTKIQGVYEDSKLVENVINAYEVIGESLETGTEIPYSPKVKKRAFALTNTLNGRITSIRFETAEKDSLISGKSSENFVAKPMRYNFGSVRGKVQTLSMRRQLNFTLWDAIFDKAINCYMREGQEEMIRDIWGERAVVSGKIGRQPDTGLPVVVRDIRDVRIVPKGEPGSYLNARGVFPWKEGDEPPEELIRRMRDD